MVASRAEHPEQYIAELPPERAEAISAVRDVILEHLPADYEERMAWGMISYVVPLDRYPDTYNQLPLDLVADEVASMTVDDYIDAFEASRN